MAEAFTTPAPKQAWPAESTPLTASKRTEHAEGFAYCAGSTKHSECGLPHQGEPLRTPRLQTRLMKEGVVQASCGWRHTAFLLSSGEAALFRRAKRGATLPSSISSSYSLLIDPPGVIRLLIGVPTRGVAY